MREKLKPYDKKIEAIDKENIEDRRNLGIEEKEKKNYFTFVKQCSFKNCKGFLENKPEEKGWNCPLCEGLTCRKCHEPLVDTIDEDGNKIKHKCKEDVLISIKELKKDTKPCPKCGTGIFKIDGCNMMFCTGCQTYFDWLTGKIPKRAAHNPKLFAG